MKRVKELIIVDLKKQRREVALRLKDFQQLYDLVKNQRNKFVNLIQASAQSIAEMKEKLKILHNEVEILRGEIVNKEKLLAKAEVDHAAAVVDRNHLQTEMNKCAPVHDTPRRRPSAQGLRGAPRVPGCGCRREPGQQDERRCRHLCVV